MIRLLMNPTFLLISVLSLLCFAGAGYLKGYRDGKAVEISKTNKEKQDAINENIQIRKTQDGVVRPDNTILIDSLRRGTF